MVKMVCCIASLLCAWTYRQDVQKRPIVFFFSIAATLRVQSARWMWLSSPVPPCCRRVWCITGLLLATHNYCLAVCRSGSAAWSSIVKQTKTKGEGAYSPDVHSLPNQRYILKSYAHNYVRGVRVSRQLRSSSDIRLFQASSVTTKWQELTLFCISRSHSLEQTPTQHQACFRHQIFQNCSKSYVFRSQNM